MPVKPKVGVITTMSLDETWPDSFVRMVEGFHGKAKTALEGLGFDVQAQPGIARTDTQMRAHGNALRQAGIEALVIQVGTWTYSSTTVTAAEAAGVPTIIWASAQPGSFGIVGGAIARGALDEMGIKTALVYGDYTDPRLLKQLDLQLRAIAAAMRLRGQRYGLGGSRCMGMVTTTIDGNQWRRQFGIDVDGWEQVEVIRRAGKVPAEDVKKFFSWMKDAFGKIEPKDEVMEAQIRLYLALRQLVKDKGYDFISVKCLPELPSCYTTFCVAHALFNDASDAFGEKEPFIAACEADSNGALTMQIMKHISGGPVLFADVLHYDYDENQVRLCNCGSQPTDFAPSRKEVYWVTEGLREFDWKIGGACPQYVAKPGRVTLARLARINGRYHMLITGGEAIAYPRVKMKETNYQQPHAFVRLDCTQEAFLDALRTNHIHMVYGDYQEHLVHTCRILDIVPQRI